MVADMLKGQADVSGIASQAQKPLVFVCPHEPRFGSAAVRSAVRFMGTAWRSLN